MRGPAQVEEDRAKFLRDQEEFKRSHRASWEIDVKEKQRLIALADDKAAFEEAVKSRRAADFAALQVRRSCCCRPAALDPVACLQLHLQHARQRQLCILRAGGIARCVSVCIGTLSVMLAV